MKNLTPKAVWENFYSLTQIPRPSGKKEEVTAFLADYGRKLGLETIVDAMGNVIIRKPASPGYENHPGVICRAIVTWCHKRITIPCLTLRKILSKHMWMANG